MLVFYGEAGLLGFALKKKTVLIVFVIFSVWAPLVLVAEFYKGALASYGGGRFLEALVLVEEALKRDDSNSNYHLLHAKILAELRQYGDAENSLGRACEIRPMSVEPYYEMGLVLFKHEKFSDAAETLQKGINVAPESMKARFLLGISYMQVQLDDAALEQLNVVEMANPTFPAVQHSIGRLYFRKGKDNEAIEYFRKELDHNSNHHGARFLLGKALLRIGKAVEAVQHFRKLRGKEVGQAQLHYYLGTAHHRIGEWKEAVEAVQNSISLNGNSYESRYLLARLYLEKGQADLARKEMSRFEQLRRREGRGKAVDPKKFDKEDREFVQADSDSNGRLTRPEFETFVNMRVKSFTRHGEFFVGLDGDGNGWLDRREFSGRFELLSKFQQR